jgi:hypothetical protein
MNQTCVICNRECENKSYSSVGGQKVCSIKCASSVSPNMNDECANCGAVVWEDENYNVNGELGCCLSCYESLKNKYKPTNSSSKKNNYSTPVSKNSKKSSKKTNNKFYPRQDQFEISPGMQVGKTNVAMGPRDWDTTDYDVGPGDTNENYFHGSELFKKYGNLEEDESEAYGDVNEKNYLEEYGPHRIIQRNENLAIEQINKMGGKLKDNSSKPKNESHAVVHRGYEVHCDYCDFIINDGDNCWVDNFGKKFHTEECFANYFQGIPKPNFG